MSSEISVGLISVGWMGRAHARAYRAIRERYPDAGALPRLLAAADVVEQNRRDAVDRCGFERAVADYREVIFDPAVDVISICSPNHLHLEMATAAADAGKPFWIEKPMGRTFTESTQIASAAAQAGLVTAVGFSYRHAPAIARARELVESGAIGTVTNIRVSFVADYSADPSAPLTWRFERAKAGSGVLGDLLSHGFDLAIHLAGRSTGRIEEVVSADSVFIPERPRPAGETVGHVAEVGNERGRVENEDHVAVLGRFESGAVGVFEASRVATGPRAEYVIEVYGSLGSLRWDFARLNELQVAQRDSQSYGYTTVVTGPGDGDFGRFQPGPGVPIGFDDLKTIEAALFLRSVVTGVQAGPSVADGAAASAVAEAAERSGRTRRWESPVPSTRSHHPEPRPW